MSGKRYTEGIAGSAAVILDNGQPIEISEILERLNGAPDEMLAVLKFKHNKKLMLKQEILKGELCGDNGESHRCGLGFTGAELYITVDSEYYWADMAKMFTDIATRVVKQKADEQIQH